VDDGERATGGLPGRLTGDDQGAARVARPEQVNVWAGLDVGKEDHLRVLNGSGIDLAADQTRLANRFRDALTSVSPAQERALGERLAPAWPR
jgi:hypothetical protein